MWEIYLIPKPLIILLIPNDSTRMNDVCGVKKSVFVQQVHEQTCQRFSHTHNVHRKVILEDKLWKWLQKRKSVHFHASIFNKKFQKLNNTFLVFPINAAEVVHLTGQIKHHTNWLNRSFFKSKRKCTIFFKILLHNYSLNIARILT